MDYRTWMPGVTVLHLQTSEVAEECPVPKVKGKRPWKKTRSAFFSQNLGLGAASVRKPVVLTERYLPAD
jgi:hypothetical protein